MDHEVRSTLCFGQVDAFNVFQIKTKFVTNFAILCCNLNLQVLGQDKQFDSLYWFDSVRKHYTAEKSRLEEGLDMDSIANGLMGLQIWSQKLASVSEEDAHNIQMVSFSAEHCAVFYVSFSCFRPGDFPFRIRFSDGSSENTLS